MHDPALEMFPLPALWIEENADDLYDMGLGRDARYAAKFCGLIEDGDGDAFWVIYSKSS